MSNLSAPLTLPALDLPALIEASRPVGNVRRVGLVVPVAWGAALAATAMGRSSSVQTVLTLAAIAATAAVSIILRSSARGFAKEQAALAQIEDRLVLKHVAQVIPELTAVLSKPMKTPENRLKALILFATALARTGRHEEALILYDDLLEQENIAGPGVATVRLSRAMALLRADRLYDADRAISDLRKRLKRPREVDPSIELFSESAVEETVSADLGERPATGDDAVQIPPVIAGNDPGIYAATRLVELYRDVKTGHPADAITAFDADREALRGGLGHRYGEALALVASAQDQLGQSDAAAQSFAEATALAPLADLVRRYPELAGVAGRYTPTPPPPRS